jgi:hypothetical protein
VSEASDWRLNRNAENAEILSRDEGVVRDSASEFHHPVPDVAVFRQVSRGSRFPAGTDHLVKWPPVVKLRVKVAAEFTRPAGADVEATGGSTVNMFHGGYLRAGNDNFARVNRIFDCALFE